MIDTSVYMSLDDYNELLIYIYQNTTQCIVVEKE